MEAEAQTAQRLALLMELRKSGVRDQRVLRAMESVSCHDFLYDTTRISPILLAQWLELLAIDERHTALHIGTDSGYVSALLSHMARRVVTIDKDATVHQATTARFERLGYDNITPICADGLDGWQDASPYDHIVVSGAVAAVPSALLEQLRDGGKMLIPLGTSHAQKLLLIEKSGWNYTRVTVSEDINYNMLVTS